MEYNSLDSYLKRTFGGKVYKLALSMGATCPLAEQKRIVGLQTGTFYGSNMP